jgi:uncharacterized membrane protein
MRTIQHPFRWLIAAALLGLAVQPVMLPHPGWVQVVIGGAAAAQGYALTALFSRLVQRWPSRLVQPWPSRPKVAVPKPAVTVALGAAMVLGAALTAHAGQVEATGRTGMPAPTLLADALAVGGAVLFGVLVIGLGFGLRAGLRLLTRGLRRTPHRLASLMLAPALILTGSTTASADSIEPATSAALSSTLGVEGVRFLAERPSAAAISAVTGRPAQTPVRVYVGQDAAPSAARRAELAVRELERTGGFRRAAVLINVPTGSGWVNPAAAAALEYLYGGDVATVVTQYASSPSWIAYLRGGEGVQSSTRALTEAIRTRLDRIPAGQRPQLLVYGESLGAWGGLRAYGDDQGVGIARRTDGALWAGVPGSRPGHSPSDTHTLVHPDDPVPAWSLPLMLTASTAWPARWLPVVSFWQATGDVIGATLVPSGHGHRYGSELVEAWRPLISTADVPGAAPPDRLNAVRRAIG